MYGEGRRAPGRRRSRHTTTQHTPSSLPYTLTRLGALDVVGQLEAGDLLGAVVEEEDGEADVRDGGALLLVDDLVRGEEAVVHALADAEAGLLVVAQGAQREGEGGALLARLGHEPARGLHLEVVVHLGVPAEDGGARLELAGLALPGGEGDVDGVALVGGKGGRLRLGLRVGLERNLLRPLELEVAELVRAHAGDGADAVGLRDLLKGRRHGAVGDAGLDEAQRNLGGSVGGREHVRARARHGRRGARAEDDGVRDEGDVTVEVDAEVAADGGEGGGGERGLMGGGERGRGGERPVPSLARFPLLSHILTMSPSARVLLSALSGE